MAMFAIECSSGFCFVDQPLPGAFVLNGFRGQDLDGHSTVER